MLNGHHALVTGGGSGIGLAIAQALAAQGAQVTIAGRRLDVLVQAATATPGLHAVQMDVTDEPSVVDGIAAAIAMRGPVTICVPNAGIATGKALHKTDMAFWRQMMAINLDGAFLTIRECLPGMKAAGWGRVVAISSIAGLRGLKGAPAYTETDIVTQNQISIAQRAGISEDEARRIMLSANRHGRLVTVDEVAAAALWLCGPHSGSVNGQCIEIAGGQA